MSNPIKNDDAQFDVRIIEHAVRRGQMTWKEVDAHLADLPDEADEAAEVETTFQATFAKRRNTESA